MRKFSLYKQRRCSKTNLTMTYDNHPIRPSNPVRHTVLNELNRPKTDLSQPPMNLDELGGRGGAEGGG